MSVYVKWCREGAFLMNSTLPQKIVHIDYPLSLAEARRLGEGWRDREQPGEDVVLDDNGGDYSAPEPMLVALTPEQQALWDHCCHVWNRRGLFGDDPDGAWIDWQYREELEHLPGFKHVEMIQSWNCSAGAARSRGYANPTQMHLSDWTPWRLWS